MSMITSIRSTHDTTHSIFKSDSEKPRYFVETRWADCDSRFTWTELKLDFLCSLGFCSCCHWRREWLLLFLGEERLVFHLLTSPVSQECTRWASEIKPKDEKKRDSTYVWVTCLSLTRKDFTLFYSFRCRLMCARWWEESCDWNH